MSRFDDCLKFVLRWEGGYSDDPADPGGATNKGVTQKTYDSWRKRQELDDRPVRNIADTEVAAIYAKDYWQPVAAPLPPPLDLAAFDTAVNCGVIRTLKWLGACWEDDAQEAKDCLLAKRRAHYENLIVRRPNMAKFRKGWFKRLEAVALAE